MFLVLLGISLLAAPIASAGDGFSLWPFKSSEKKPAAKKPAKAPTKTPAKESNWMKLPGFGSDSKTATKKSAPRKQESTLTKMNNSTKRFFSNAKDALTPGSKKTVSTKPSGYGAGGSTKTTAKKTSKKSADSDEDQGNILTSWWKSKDPEPKRPRSVPEFISGDRPE
jgi:hypothetical protein